MGRIRYHARGLLVLLGATGSLLAASPLLAFCRSTIDCKSDVCDEDDEACQAKTNACKPDTNGCPVGTPISWPTPCISYSVNKGLSRKYDSEKLHAVIRRSVATWNAVVCDPQTADGKPLCTGNNCKLPVRLKEYPTVTAEDTSSPGVGCTRNEYNPTLPNANLVFFNDTKFVYKDEQNTLARTKTSKNAVTGDILDADIEINSSQNIFALEEDQSDIPPTGMDETTGKPVFDLQSILVHEIGHFLGLAHSQPGTTMFKAYDRTQRTLTKDDIDGICSIYLNYGGANACDFTPRNGFSGDCPESNGSAVTPACSYMDGPRAGFSHEAGWAMMVSAGLLGWWWSKRKKVCAQSPSR